MINFAELFTYFVWHTYFKKLGVCIRCISNNRALSSPKCQANSTCMSLIKSSYFLTPQQIGRLWTNSLELPTSIHYGYMEALFLGLSLLYCTNWIFFWIYCDNMTDFQAPNLPHKIRFAAKFELLQKYISKICYPDIWAYL